MLQRAIADVALIEKQILHSIVGPVDGGIDDESVDAMVTTSLLDGDQCRRRFPVRKNPQSVHSSCSVGWQIVLDFAVVHERQVDLRIGQRDAGEGFDDVTAFGLRCPQEFASYGSIEKQITDFDGRAARASRRRPGVPRFPR